ncbi:MAG TPA: peptidoglycan-binding protein, partial [Usitatibacter sp.]|nr:peptidoglycan-binding protein [Usitatibacter sp.]
MKQLAICLVIAALAAGCASKEKQPDAGVTDRSAGTTPPSTSTTPSTSSTTTPNRDTNVSGDPLRDPNNVLYKRSVYFDFDSNAVKDEYRNLVQAHARYMNDKRESKIRIEGN